MLDWALIWVSLGLLLWLFTLLVNDPKSLAERQWLVAVLLALFWPFILVAALWELTKR